MLTLVLLAIRSPASFEEGSPEALVQDYLQAVLADDEREAAGYFAAESACSAEDFSRRQPAKNVRITLVNSETFGDEAEVTVRLRYDETNLGAVTYSDWEESFSLVREAGAWRLDGQPWPLFFCEDPA